MKKSEKIKEIISTLKEVKIFKELTDEELEKLSSVMEYKKLPKGTNIIKEGEYGDTLYILKSGIVSVLKKTLENEEYVVVTLESKKGNIHFFGELALLDNDKRSATVRAESDVEVFIINRDDFLMLGNKYPKMGLIITREISKMLAARLRKANEDIITLFEALVEKVSPTSI